MFPFKVYYQLFLHDENGKLLWKSRKRRSKSFVIQWLQFIMVKLKQTNVPDMKDTGGALRTFPPSSQLGAVNAGAGVTTHGIVVGTGTTPPANDNYCLQSLIAHGSGAGQLQYGSQGFTDPAIVAGNVDAVLTRAMVNGSGATITVNEIGLYFWSGSYYFCGIRDVLPVGKGVPNGQTLTVQYTLRTTV